MYINSLRLTTKLGSNRNKLNLQDSPRQLQAAVWHTHVLINAIHCPAGNACNMGTRDLPDMYARGPWAQGLRAYILGKSQERMLQVTCITFDCRFWI